MYLLLIAAKLQVITTVLFIIRIPRFSTFCFLAYWVPFLKEANLLHMRKQRRRSALQYSTFVFARQIVQSLFYLNPKFQASSYLLGLYSLVCVGPVGNLEDHFFSQRGSSYSIQYMQLLHNLCILHLYS